MIDTSTLEGVVEDVRVHGDVVLYTLRTSDHGTILASLPRHLPYASQVWVGARMRMQGAVRGKEAWSLDHARLVLEPHVLLDVTDVAACITSSGIDPRHILLRRLPTTEVSPHIIFGSVVNSMLDVVLQDPQRSDEHLLADAFDQRPLSIAALHARDASAVDTLKERARRTIPHLRAAAESFPGDGVVIEPSFVAAAFGLQGRLDVMTVYASDPHRHDVIELKTSKPLAGAMAVHPQYAAQVAAYDLLLESADPQRSGTSMVCYANDLGVTMRIVDVHEDHKRLILHARNQVLCLQRQLREKDFQALRSIRATDLGWSSYERRDAERFEDLYQQADVVSRTYVQAFTSFIENEADALRSSVDDDRALVDLQLDMATSDLVQWHLTFLRTTDHAPTSLRRGDIVVLSAIQDDADRRMTHVYKATIVELDAQHVRVSLRNKQTDASEIAGIARWRIVSDVSESLLRAQHRELFTFLATSAQTRSLILGLARPGSRPHTTSTLPATLHPSQRLVIEKALSSTNYALIQGPPGTGKTSIVVRTLVEQLLLDPSERILLLACTNRAVDEIVAVLHAIGSTEHVRVGGASNMYRIMAEALPTARIVVGTVAALQTYAEVFSIVSFTTAIIDEASQLVESQICGMLTRVGRFMLIGDEKQLPAVVLQDEERTSVRSTIFSPLCLSDLRTSLFERLLHVAARNGWSDHVGTLRVQARMHDDIQRIANELVYHGQLESARPWQRDPSPSPRVRYIASPVEPPSTVAMAEAAMVADILRERFASDAPPTSIGVITPFRTQINAIRSLLPDDIRNAVSIDTVERYQGSERDTIIICLACHTPQQLRSAQSILHDNGTIIDRKFNVAVTRARKELIVIGRRDVMEQVEPYSQFLTLIT
jgi:DNA replication ATP-dependent helicase Dna2